MSMKQEETRQGCIRCQASPELVKVSEDGTRFRCLACGSTFSNRELYTTDGASEVKEV